MWSTYEIPSVSMFEWMMTLRRIIHDREKVLIPRTKPFITLEGSGNTTIQWGDTANMLGADGSPIGTYKTATVGVDASYFIVKNILR